MVDGLMSALPRALVPLPWYHRVFSRTLDTPVLDWAWAGPLPRLRSLGLSAGLDCTRLTSLDLTSHLGRTPPLTIRL